MRSSIDDDAVARADRAIDDVIRPAAVSVDRDALFPQESLAALAAQGLGVVSMPVELGGSNGSSATNAEVLARVSAACGSTSTVYMTQMHCAHPIHLAGTDAQVKSWIPRLCDATAVGAIALTEPSAGSDVSSMRTTALRDGDDYVINGEKTFISNGDRADVIVLFASIDTTRGKDAITAFLLETDGLQGFEPGSPMKKLGQKGGSTVTLSFVDCRIPATWRLGEEGGGYPLLLRSVVRSRISAAAQGVGFAQGAFDVTVRHLAGQDMLSSRNPGAQDAQFHLARLRGEISAARSMLHDVCDLVDSDPGDPVADVSLVKLHCTTHGTQVAAACLELLGPDGDSVALGAERYLRDAKIAEIYDGTNQVQSMLVARDIRIAAERTEVAPAGGQDAR